MKNEKNTITDPSIIKSIISYGQLDADKFENSI